LQILFLISQIRQIALKEAEQVSLREEKEAPFVEHIEDQEPYLEFVNEEDLFYLDLYNLDRTLKTSDFSNNPSNETTCPNRIMKSFKLKSFFMPVIKPPIITECPTMKETCCSVTDIERLKNLWETKFSVYLDFNYQYFDYYIKEIFNRHQEIGATARLVLDSYQHEICKKVSKTILETEITPEILSKINTTLNKLKTFDRNQKENFICLLCDYNSIRFWDLNQRFIPLHYDVCESIVENTFDEIYYLNNFIYKYINTANFLSYCVNNENLSKFGDLNLENDGFFSFLEIENSLSIEACKIAKETSSNVMANCFHFCSSYNYWRFEKPAFRSIVKLSKIFNNLNDKIFKKDLDYKIREPKSVSNMLPIFEPEYDDANIFELFDYIYTEEEGVKPNVFFQQQLMS
jgi:hypothetical protein